MTLRGVLQVQNSKLIISAFDYDNGAGEKDNFRLWIGTHFFFLIKPEFEYLMMGIWTVSSLGSLK